MYLRNRARLAWTTLSVCPTQVFFFFFFCQSITARGRPHTWFHAHTSWFAAAVCPVIRKKPCACKEGPRVVCVKPLWRRSCKASGEYLVIHKTKQSLYENMWSEWFFLLSFPFFFGLASPACSLAEAVSLLKRRGKNARKKKKLALAPIWNKVVSHKKRISRVPSFFLFFFSLSHSVASFTWAITWRAFSVVSRNSFLRFNDYKWNHVACTLR